ncbi:PEP-CTERM sorting domain-containing protein [Pelomonas sp. KK5]
MLPPSVNTPSTSTTPPATTPAVPEPSSWALLLAGVGVLALVGSRRRRAS